MHGVYTISIRYVTLWYNMTVSPFDVAWLFDRLSKRYKRWSGWENVEGPGKNRVMSANASLAAYVTRSRLQALYGFVSCTSFIRKPGTLQH